MILNFKFSEIADYIKNKFRELGNYKQDLLEISVIKRIFDSIAYAIEKYVYYVDFLYKNSFLSTATSVEYIIPKLRMLNYEYPSKKGATGYILVAPIKDFFKEREFLFTTYSGSGFYVDQYTQLDARNGLKYYIDQPINFQIDEKFMRARVVGEAIYVDNDTIKIFIQIPNFEGNHPFLSNLEPGKNIYIIGSRYYDGNYKIMQGSGNIKLLLDPDTDQEYDVMEIYLNVFDFREENFFKRNVYAFIGHQYIPIKQGEIKIYTYKTKGEINESFKIYSTNIDTDTIRLRLLNEKREYVSDIQILKDKYINEDKENYYAEVRILNKLNGIEIEFGDDILYKKIPSEYYVEVLYSEVAGESGNILGYDAITGFSESIIDYSGAEVDLDILQIDPVLGGKDFYPIDELREVVPSYFFSLNRGHSKTDWETLLKGFHFLHRVKVWSEYDVNPLAVNDSFSGIVYIAGINKRLQPLTSAEKNTIATSIKPKQQSITDVIYFKDLKILNLKVIGDLRVRGRTIEQFNNDIYNAIYKRVGLMNSKFGQSVYYTDVISYIKQDLGDDVINMSLNIYYCERSDNNSQIDNRVSMFLNGRNVEVSQDKIVEILEGSLSIWILRKIDGVWGKDELVAVAKDRDTDGNFLRYSNITSQHPLFSSVTGIINYETGFVTFNIEELENYNVFGVINPTEFDPNGYILKIVYKTRDKEGDYTNDLRNFYDYVLLDFKRDDMDFIYNYER